MFPSAYTHPNLTVYTVNGHECSVQEKNLNHNNKKKDFVVLQTTVLILVTKPILQSTDGPELICRRWQASLSPFPHYIECSLSQKPHSSVLSAFPSSNSNIPSAKDLPSNAPLPQVKGHRAHLPLAPLTMFTLPYPIKTTSLLLGRALYPSALLERTRLLCSQAGPRRKQ